MQALREYRQEPSGSRAGSLREVVAHGAELSVTLLNQLVGRHLPKIHQRLPLAIAVREVLDLDDVFC